MTDRNREIERRRIEQSNRVAEIVIRQIGEHRPDVFVTLDLRYGIADALWAEGIGQAEIIDPAPDAPHDRTAALERKLASETDRADRWQDRTQDLLMIYPEKVSAAYEWAVSMGATDIAKAMADWLIDSGRFSSERPIAPAADAHPEPTCYDGETPEFCATKGCYANEHPERHRATRGEPATYVVVELRDPEPYIEDGPFTRDEAIYKAADCTAQMAELDGSRYAAAAVYLLEPIDVGASA